MTILQIGAHSAGNMLHISNDSHPRGQLFKVDLAHAMLRSILAVKRVQLTDTQLPLVKTG